MFSINGQKIRETTFDGSIVCWTTYSDTSGFDFIVFSEQFGSIYRFEVFSQFDHFIEITKFPREKIISIKCNSISQSLMIITQSGKFSILHLEGY